MKTRTRWCWTPLPPTAPHPDGSTAFRSFPPPRRKQFRTAKRIAVPGCHASGFIALTAPLRAAGILPGGTLLSCFSLTGYSGGGKKMIAEYEMQPSPAKLHAPRQYALGQSHKHLPRNGCRERAPRPRVLPCGRRFLQRDAGHGAAVRGAVRTGNHERADCGALPGYLPGTRGPASPKCRTRADSCPPLPFRERIPCRSA